MALPFFCRHLSIYLCSIVGRKTAGRFDPFRNVLFGLNVQEENCWEVDPCKNVLFGLNVQVTAYHM